MTVMSVPINKAGKSFEVDLSSLPEEVYAQAMLEGLKVLLAAGITSSKFPTKGLEGEELAKAQEAISAKVEENVANLYSGNLKKSRAASTSGKVPGVVMTEARRLAKAVVKDEIRAAGGKVSHYEASEITKAANALIEADPSFIEMAKANIEARTAKLPKAEGADKAAAAQAFLNSLGGVKASEKKIKAAEEEKLARKATLSAAKAGKVAPRKGSQATAH